MAKEKEQRWTLERIAEVASRERKALTNALKTLTAEIVDEAETHRNAEMCQLRTDMSTQQRRLKGLEDRMDWMEEALEDGSNG